MVKPVIRKTFDEIEKALTNRENIVKEKFVSEITLFKVAIEHSFYLSDLIRTRLEKKAIATSTKLDGPRALIPFLYPRNNHYLLAAYYLALKGLNNQSMSLIRTVFEGILHLYLLHLTEKEAWLFFKNETNQLSKEEKEELKKKRYLSPNVIFGILYTKDTIKTLKKFYGYISKSSHPSIRSVMWDFQYNYESTKDTFFVILALCFSNLLVISEIYSNKLRKKEKEKTDEILNKIANKIEALPDLIPDKPDFIEKLKIRF
jgi:hypothetical protein